MANGNSAETEIAPIERPTLHEVVVSRLRDMIIEGQLPAGNRIHEGELCQHLGISRTPLREALKVLAMEGLVDLTPGRGATVRRLTAKDILDMLSVLSALERLAGTLTCQQATDEDIQEIRRLHDEMLSFYAAGDSGGHALRRNDQRRRHVGRHVEERQQGGDADAEADRHAVAQEEGEDHAKNGEFKHGFLLARQASFLRRRCAR